MEPLDLARRRRRPRCGQQVLDAVLPADPVEEHLTGPWPEPAGEHLPVIGEDRVGDTVAAHRQRQRVTGRPSRRPRDHERGDAEPRVVIDTGDDLRLDAVDEADPADDVHLPQLHRPGPFPTQVVGLLPLPGLRRDEPVTDQAAVDRRPPRQRRRRLHVRANDRSSGAPTPDARSASPRSAPRQPGPSGADTNPAPSTRRPSRPTPAPRTS